MSSLESEVGGIAFIGAGRMASAMVGGLLSRGVYQPHQIRCISADDGTAHHLSQKTGIVHARDFQDLLRPSAIAVLACKPQQLDDLPDSARSALAQKILLSILAGTPIQRLRSVFSNVAGIVRAMPNTPGQIGAGITAFAAESCIEAANLRAIISILETLGPVFQLQEELLHLITGLSGSGPAYVFEFVAGLRDAGIAGGLEPDVAYEFAIQTVRGSAELLKQVPESPETHRDWVSSPGGTTLAGLAVLQSKQFRQTLLETVSAAAARSRELAD